MIGKVRLFPLMLIVRISHPTHKNLTRCNVLQFHRCIQDNDSYQEVTHPLSWASHWPSVDMVVDNSYLITVLNYTFVFEWYVG